jgi:uncharacterized lipoprotein NlpE involved in copper resistance
VNKRIVAIVVVVLVLAIGYLVLARQTNPTQQSNTNDSPTVADDGKDRAIYEGNIPCADCEGIQVRLNLKDNGKYKMTSVYLGKNVQPLIEKGTWTTETGDATDPNATVYILTSSENVTTYFLDSGNELKQLDENKKLVTNPYAMNLMRKK